MDLKQRVFAAADRLALELGDIDLVGVAAVRARSNGQIARVGEILKDWRQARRAFAFYLPTEAREAAVGLAGRLFILGMIRLLDHSRAPTGADPKLAALLNEIASHREDAAARRVAAAPPGSGSDVTGRGGPAAVRNTPYSKRRLNGPTAAEQVRVAPDLGEGRSEIGGDARLRRLRDAVWRRAERPDLAKAAAQALRKAGYPLGHEELNRRFPVR